MRGGIRLEGKKDASLLEWTIHRPYMPSRVMIPLSQSNGASARPCVRAGQTVLMGEKIANPNGDGTVAIHASISGKVSRVGPFPHPILEESAAVEIESDGTEKTVPQAGKERKDWQDLSDDALLEILREMGLVNLDAQMESLPAKILAGKRRSADALVINACESEPYVTCDHALAMSHSVEVLRGAEILRRLTGAGEIVIATEEKNLAVTELFRSKIYFLKWKHARVEIFPSLYPQGEEVLLVREMRKRGRLDRNADKPAMAVFNTATAYAAHEAIVFQRPLYERVVTVGGECVVEPRNLWVRIGTSFGDAIRGCRGLLREPRKLIMGGPMKGLAQASQDVPVVKGTQAILALPKEVARAETEEPCIRCGRCIEACPVEISPMMITLSWENGRADGAEDSGIRQCIECGNCAYVCPSKRPMVELIRAAKSELFLPAKA